ncbi:MAG: DoxX family protein [Ilumatobacteraceae bacterium]
MPEDYHSTIRGTGCAMFGIRTLARSLIASAFIAGGLNALTKAKQLAPGAEDVAQPIAARLGLTQDTETLVKMNAGLQIASGGLFALGVAPRLTGVVLGATLVPTTLAGHAFWQEKDAADRNRQILAFSKNAAILGGLLYVALDTGGRPSVFWSSRKAAIGAGEAIGHTARSVADTLTPH